MSTNLRKHGSGIRQPEWFVHAACRRLSVEQFRIFYPENLQDPAAATTAAKSVCAPCPVRSSCLKFGDQNSPKWGIFGGLTANERKHRRERTAAA